MSKYTAGLALLALFSIIPSASAAMVHCSGCVCIQPPNKCVCDIVCNVAYMVQWALTVIAPSLVIIMFTYGGVKYAFSADDPAGRKSGKMTCVHAVIGGMILLIVGVVISWVGTGCGACL